MKDKKKQIIRFDHPAEAWNEAIPIGNGSLGAMLFGDMDEERIQFNTDTFWSGYPHNRVLGVSADWLEAARSALRNKEFQRAEELVHTHMEGEEVAGYQPVGTLYLDYQLPDGGEYGSRTLTLDTGIHCTKFRAQGREYVTEAFASFHRDVLAVRVMCEGPAYFKLRLEGHYVKERYFEDNALILRGQAPEISNQLAYYYPERRLHCQGDRGIRYEAAVAAETDGTLRQECESLWIEGATELFICIGAVTSFQRMSEKPDRPFRGRALEAARRGLALGYEALRKEHIAWFYGHMGRLTLELEETAVSALPTDQRLEAVNCGKADPALSALYAQFGRYLLLSSSAKGMPANLQGIWNESEKARWNSNYTLNINLPMNYWLAEIGNLAFCHEPLFTFLDQARVQGKQAAKAYFGCRGFFMAHNSDLWGSANPVQGYPRCISWTTGGAWLCRHIWEHYRFSGDSDHLRTYFPIIEEAARFILDYLAEDSDGTLSYFPSSSPENEYLVNGSRVGTDMGSTMELTLVRELLEEYLSAMAVLEMPEGEQAMEARASLRQLRRLNICQDGRLSEWSRDVKEAEPGHRHFSHLYGVFPGELLEDDPKLWSAARKSLDYRMRNGGGHTGWSAAWAICLYARFGEGERAYECIRKLWGNSTFSNLFDTCNGVFQIDGNLGAAAGILEMLVQSHRNRIELLPALPEAWASGSLRGVRLRGGGELDMDWKCGSLTWYQIRGGSSLPVYYEGKRLK